MPKRFCTALCAFLALSGLPAYAADECTSSLQKRGIDQGTAAQFDNGTSAFRIGDYATAFESWKRLADNGNCQAQFNVGTLYLKGRGVPINVNAALEWFRKAAEQGHANAQFNLAEAYRVGTGITKDQKQAVFWYRKAADQGHTVAQLFLAIAYETGDGVERDFSKAFQYYWKAVEAGDAIAQYNLGLMYAFGNGVSRDKVMAYFHVSIAAASGNNSAIKAIPIIAAKMTVEQLAEAKQMIRIWKPGSQLPDSSMTGKDVKP